MIGRIILRDASDRAAALDTPQGRRHCSQIMLLQVITASTRPSRVGPKIAEWFIDVARRDAGFEIEPVDLAEVNLPILDEPEHPRFQRYRHAHTKAWSERVSRADAYVFVTPEYNHMPTPALINAIDYLVHEWACKPAGFVSYGGVSAGLRAVQQMKPMLAGLKVVPMVEGVAIPFFPNHLDKQSGKFVAPEGLEGAAHAMLKELHRWAVALKPLRGTR